MLARTWSGRTPASKADAYSEFLKTKGIQDYLATAGNRGVVVLRRDLGDVAEFLLISLWDSEDSIRAFAGEDVTKAFYYPEDDGFLLEFAPRAAHYEVLHQVRK
jgi:heme-degrading monooxygenase HmoA